MFRHISTLDVPNVFPSQILETYKIPLKCTINMNAYSNNSIYTCAVSSFEAWENVVISDNVPNSNVDTFSI